MNQPCSAGNIYVGDGGRVIRRIDTSGTVLTIAGNPTTIGYANGVGGAAKFNFIGGITIDAAGDLYVADLNNQVIRKIVLNLATHIGTVTTIAGIQGSSGSTIGAIGAATFDAPWGIAADTPGILYVSEYHGMVVRKIDTIGGTVTAVAGLANTGGAADGTGTAARFAFPQGITLGQDGNLYLADAANNVIRKITPAGVVTTLAGAIVAARGQAGSSDTTGPRTLTATFDKPTGIALDEAGNIYVSEANNQVIRKITAAGEVSLVAGNNKLQGSSNGNGSAAGFGTPNGLAMDSARNIYVAESASTLRKIDSFANVSLLAGTFYNSGAVNGIGAIALFSTLKDVAVDSSGNLYVADYGNNLIRKIDTGNNVTTFAGPASFNGPHGITIDSANNLYVANRGSHNILKVDLYGIVTVYAGQTGVSGSANATAALSATLNNPTKVALDAYGNMYVCDSGNQLIRKIAANGTVTTLAGTVGVTGLADGIGTAASFKNPLFLNMGPDGNIYVADTGNNTIRKVTPAGVVTTLYGIAGIPGTNNTIRGASQFLKQGAMTKGTDGSLYVADTFNHLIRKVDSSGYMTVLAGSGTEGSADGNGAAASFRYPQGIAINSAGNLYVADTFNHTIRKITPSGVVTTFAGTAGVNGPITTNYFNYPQGISIDSYDNLYVADTINAAIRKISPAGSISNVSGQGLVGYADGSYSSAMFGYLKSISLDYNNNIYVTDSSNNVIRKITNFLGIATNVETLIGFILESNSNSYSYSVPSGTAVGSDINGNIYIVDYTNSLIKKISANGVATVVAGTAGIAAFATGNLPSTLIQPTSMYVDPTGAYLYLIENNNLMRIELDFN